MIDDTNLAPFAIVQFDDSYEIDDANDVFRWHFFESYAMDLARRNASASRMLRELVKIERDEATEEFERRDLGACDQFYFWAKHRFETRVSGVIHYPRPVPAEEIYQIPPLRHFRYKLFLNHDNTNMHVAYIEPIAQQIQAVSAVNSIGGAINDSIRGLMVENQDGETPGLAYEIRTRREDMGKVGGDFVFDYTMQRGKRSKPSMRLSMFGDAAADNVVGGLMVRDVGRILRSICSKPKTAMKEAKGRTAVNALARHFNERLLDQDGTGSTGVDGTIVITDIEKERLLIAEGQSEIYVFERTISEASEIKTYGNMYFSERPSSPKSFGTRPDQKFNAYTHKKVTHDTMVVAFSDGFSDIFREGRVSLREEVMSVLKKLDRSEENLEKSILKLLYEKADDLRLQYRLRLEKLDDDGSAPGRYDDEMLCVFSPMRRLNPVGA